MDFKTPLTWPAGAENMGGYKNRIAFIPASAVSAVPALVNTAPTDDDDLVQAVGAFTFITVGQKPMGIYCTDKTVKYGAEPQGELDAMSYAQAGEFFHPGNSKTMHAFNRQAINTPGYLIIEDPKGTQYMVGSEGMPCYIKPSFDGGAGRTDRRGTKYTFGADSYCTAVELATPIDMDTLFVV